jgi:ribosomal protein S10
VYTEKDKLPLKVQVCINSLTEYFVEVAKIYQGCTAGELPLAATQQRWPVQAAPPQDAEAHSEYSGGSANGKIIDFQRRLTNAYRHALALFTAHADTAIQLQIVTDHGNLLHRFNPGTNQGRPFTAFVTFPFSIR